MVAHNDCPPVGLIWTSCPPGSSPKAELKTPLKGPDCAPIMAGQGETGSHRSPNADCVLSKNGTRVWSQMYPRPGLLSYMIRGPLLPE